MHTSQAHEAGKSLAILVTSSNDSNESLNNANLSASISNSDSIASSNEEAKHDDVTDKSWRHNSNKNSQS